MNFGIINIFNSFVVIILLIPNLIYAIKHSKFKIIYKSIQLLGMFACIESMILMVFPIGINEFGFGSSEEMLIYVFYNITLISVYNILWRLFNKQKRIKQAFILTLIPFIIFLLNGIVLRYPALIIFTVIFGIIQFYTILKTNTKNM